MNMHFERELKVGLIYLLETVCCKPPTCKITITKNHDLLKYVGLTLNKNRDASHICCW